MGEVYKAQDTTLDRWVALKILPPDLVRNEDRVRRFVQEAKAASGLSHPHIVTIYEVGEVPADGQETTRYIAMEFVHGVTLRTKIHEQRTPLKELLEYLAQAADALAKAHAAGIVHRDLKPENIMVTQDGFTKVVDFGLAKLVEKQREFASSDSATALREQTREGMVVGTLGYMSPEQVRGQQVDHRSDIFSLGCILYEAATRQKPFVADSDVDVLHRIMHGEPASISEIAPTVPAELRRMIRRCLMKDPDRRYQSMKDIAIELRDLSQEFETLGSGAIEPGGVARTAVQPARMHRRDFLFAATGAAAGVAGAELVRFFTASDRSGSEPEFFSIAAPPGIELEIDYGAAPQLSPDGTKVVFVAQDDEGRTALWLRSLHSPQAHLLPGTEGGRQPFWSPDGRQIGFFSPGDDGKLKRLDLASGAIVELADAPFSSGGSWSIRNQIVFVPVDSPVRVMPATGGTPHDATKRGRAEIERAHTFPSFLPDGRHFIYHAVILGDRPRAVIRVGSIDGQTTRELMPSASAARYAAPGYLLYRQERDLIARRFDSDRFVADTQIVKLAERLTDSQKDLMASASDRGDLLYHTGAVTGQTELVWFDRDGRELQRLGARARYRRPSISLDGRRIAVEIPDPVTTVSTVWILDIARNSRTPLTGSRYGALLPAWSPDDQYISFVHAQASAGDVAIKRVDAPEPEQVLESNPSFTIPTDWSPGGDMLVLHERTPDDTSFDLFLFSIRERKRTLFARNATAGRFSPDGEWIIFSSNSEVFAQRLTGDSRRWQISTDGGGRPRWSRDGKEIFYTSKNRLMAVPVSASGNRLEVGIPRVVLAASSRIVPFPHPPYDLAPDGRILVTVESEQQVAPLTLVRNWPRLIGG